MLLVKEGARNCLAAHAAIAHICPVADPGDLRVVELEPRVELLRIKVRPVVPPVVNDHAPKDVDHAVAGAALPTQVLTALLLRNVIYLVEAQLRHQQVVYFSDGRPVVIHVDVGVLQTNCVDEGQLEQPSFFSLNRLLAPMTRFLLFSVLDLEVAIAADDRLHDLCHALFALGQLAEDV